MEATRTILLLVLAGASACGGAQRHTDYHFSGHDQATMADVDVRPGPLPEAETFSGVYHSQEIGEVTLEQTGDTVVGTYEYDRASCHARGRIEGQAEGNLLRFHWTEDQRQCGILNVPPGRGYFLFWKDSAHNGRLSGEWGYAENESGGGRWALFRSPNRNRRVEPTPGTSGGDNSSGGSSSGGTSSGGTSSGGSNAPAGDPLLGL